MNVADGNLILNEKKKSQCSHSNWHGGYKPIKLKNTKLGMIGFVRETGTYEV